MNDIMRYLPLSQGDRPDESAVHSDRRTEYAEVLEQAAVVIDTEPSVHLADRDLERVVPRGAPPTESEPATRLRSLAHFARTGPRKIPVRLLSHAVLLYLTAVRQSTLTPTLAPITSGAVALHLAATAPTEIRAVIKGHALRATDAGWEFGRGPVLEATAVEMVEFLGGRSLIAPKRAAK